MDLRALANGQQQVELLGEEGVIVLELQPKQLKRLDKRASSDHDFRAAVREEIERGEFLKDSHGVGCAQHRHGAGQTNSLGPGGYCGENDCRR